MRMLLLIMLCTIVFGDFIGVVQFPTNTSRSPSSQLVSWKTFQETSPMIIADLTFIYGHFDAPIKPPVPGVFATSPDGNLIHLINTFGALYQYNIVTKVGKIFNFPYFPAANFSSRFTGIFYQKMMAKYYLIGINFTSIFGGDSYIFEWDGAQEILKVVYQFPSEKLRSPSYGLAYNRKTFDVAMMFQPKIGKMVTVLYNTISRKLVIGNSTEERLSNLMWDEERNELYAVTNSGVMRLPSTLVHFNPITGRLEEIYSPSEDSTVHPWYYTVGVLDSNSKILYASYTSQTRENYFLVRYDVKRKTVESVVTENGPLFAQASHLSFMN